MKKASAPQPTMSLFATHYPSETRTLGLPTSLRRPTKAALISVVADTVPILPSGTELPTEARTQRTRPKQDASEYVSSQRKPSRHNRCDRSAPLDLSISWQHGTRQIVYICRDTSDFVLSPGACVALGIVSPNFPDVDHRSETDVSACNAASESSMTAACEYSRRQPPPPPPKELPYPAVEENREKLE